MTEDAAVEYTAEAGDGPLPVTILQFNREGA